MPQDITLQHIEITEELRSHRLEGPYYKVASFSGIMRVLDDDAAQHIADRKIRTFEIIEVRGPGIAEKRYYGVDIGKIGMLNALLGWSEQKIVDRIAEAVASNNSGMMVVLREQVAMHVKMIKNLPWYKRLFNQF